MKILLLFLVSLTVLGQKKTEEYKFLVGNYSKKGAKGIYYCKYNPNNNTHRDDIFKNFTFILDLTMLL